VLVVDKGSIPNGDDQGRGVLVRVRQTTRAKGNNPIDHQRWLETGSPQGAVPRSRRGIGTLAPFMAYPTPSDGPAIPTWSALGCIPTTWGWDWKEQGTEHPICLRSECPIQSEKSGRETLTLHAVHGKTGQAPDDPAR